MQLLYVNEMWEKLFEICLPSEEEEKNDLNVILSQIISNFYNSLTTK